MNKAYFFLLALWGSLSSARDICFHIVTASYNNERYSIRNIEMMAKQTYTHWHMVIINDCSTDATGRLLREYIDAHQLQNKVTLITNTRNCGACRNIDDAIRGSTDTVLHGQIISECPDNRVVVIYDGDDCWTNIRSLERISHEYQNPKVWLTYGQFRIMPEGVIGWCHEFPRDVCKRGSFRDYGVVLISSHPRTFRAWLYKRIRQKDLIDPRTQDYLRVTGDTAIMFPMLEMAAHGHIRFISDVIYDYNGANPLSDWRVQGSEEQMYVDRMIRAMPRYEPL